jgi:hypothetical protein
MLHGRGTPPPGEDLRSAIALVEASGEPAERDGEAARQLAAALDALDRARAGTGGDGAAAGDLRTLAALVRTP